MSDQDLKKEDDNKKNESTVHSSGNIFEGKTEDQAVKTDSDQNKSTVKQPDYDAIFADKLGSIVDGNGEAKYKDVMTALEALKFSQDHIKTLEEENKSYKEKLTMEDTLKQANSNIAAKNKPEDKTTSEGVDAEKIKGMTFEAIQEFELLKQAEANKKSVSDALVNKYGSTEKAKAAYEDKAKELGLTVTDFLSLTEKSPKAVLSYFDSKDTSHKSMTSSGTVNTESLSGKKEEDVDYSARYFNTSNPSLQKWREVVKSKNS